MRYFARNKLVYCRHCVQPDTRPGIVFNQQGICSACRIAQTQALVNWDKRRQELEVIVQFGKSHNVSGYDCIIGVSGGKDSVREAIYVRDELNMKPLLVSCTYPPEQLNDRGAHNLDNLISLGFDCISVGPDPQTWKALMKQGFLKYGNWAKSTEVALYSSAPHIAVAYHIPLIFLGESPAITLGDLGAGSITGDANRMKYMHTLKGGVNGLAEDWMSAKNLYWYRYPSDTEMSRVSMRIVWLQYYIKDFNRFTNAQLAVKLGLQIRHDSPQNIGDLYGFSALDEDFVIVNQMLKYLKFGFGQVTDQVCEAIRLGMMTRAEAIKLVKKYDGKCADKYIDKFCRYIGISKQKFWQVAESFRNRAIWEKNRFGQWQLKTLLT